MRSTEALEQQGERLVAALHPAVRAWSSTINAGSRSTREAMLGVGDLARGRVGGHRWLPWALANGVNPVDCGQVTAALPAWGDQLERLCENHLLSEWTAYNAWSAARSWHRWLTSEHGLAWECRGLYEGTRRWPWLIDPQRSSPAALLTVAEIARMIRSAEATGGTPLSQRRTHALICMLAATGCRISEAAGMRRRDLQLGTRSGSIRWRTKGGYRRCAELPEWCVTALRRYFDARSVLTGRLLGEEPVLAPLSPGTVWTQVRDATLRAKVVELGRVAGVEQHVTPHVIRASLITRALSHGRTVDDVRAWSGHRDRRSVEHYDRRNPGVAVGADLADEIAEALAR